jgi:hypothetical protein
VQSSHPTPHNSKERTMNTRQAPQRTAALASLALAAVLTLAMLAGVDTLARTDAPARQMAQAHTPRA